MTTAPSSSKPLPDRQRARLGVALFESPNPDAGGWALSPDGHAGRISGADCLDSRVSWVTNLPSSNLAWLLDNKTLIPSVDYCCRLLGHTPFDKSALRDAVDDLSAIVQTVSHVLHHAYGVDFANYRSLPAALGQAIFSRFNPLANESDLAYQSVFNEADRPYHETACTRPLTAIPVTLRFPPAEYARLLLEYPLPDGGWSPFKGQFPRNYSPPQDAAYRFLSELGSRQPALVKLAFRRPAVAAHAPLLDPVSMAGPKEWFAVHEAIQLAVLGEVAIRDILVSPHYIPAAAASGYALPDLGPLSEYAPSFGLIAEAHWRTLARPVFTRGRARSHPAGLWLQAWDRLHCLPPAMALLDLGLTVAGFGNGEVVVLCPPERIDDTHRVAQSFGMWSVSDK